MVGAQLHMMAWRNLWRNTRRTLISLASFAFGMLLAIVFTGVADSSYGKIVDLAARSGGGYVTLQHPDYLDAPTIGKTVDDAPGLAALAERQPHVTRAIPRVTGSTMLATAHSNYGAYFIAVDPAAEDPESLAIIDSISEGAMISTADAKEIVLGGTLADNLDVELQQKVVYTMTDKRGEIVSGLARVSGIIRSGAPTVDTSLCVLPIDLVRGVVGYEPDEATEVAVFVDDQHHAAEVADELVACAGPDVAARTWRETQAELAAFIQMDSTGAMVFEAIVIVLVAAGIFNSLFVSVMEREREFGIMAAIGFSPGQLLRLVVWESLWLALVGLVVSAVITVGPYWYLHVYGLDYSDMMGAGTEVSGVVLDPVMYTDIQLYKVPIIVALLLGTTLLAGLYPAWRASRVVPVEAIRIV